MDLKITLELTRRDEAALRSIKSYGLHGDTGIVRVALRRLIRMWNATPEYAPLEWRLAMSWPRS